MPDTRFWITARLEGDKLGLTVSGAQTILDDEDDHRTREVVTSLDLGDPAAIRSARALLYPLTRAVVDADNSDEARANLDARREAALPSPDAAALKALTSALQSVMDAYGPPVQRVLRRQAAAATASALQHDSETDPAIADVAPRGDLRVRKVDGR